MASALPPVRPQLSPVQKSLVVGAATLVPHLAFKVATSISEHGGAAAFVGTVIGTLCAYDDLLLPESIQGRTIIPATAAGSMTLGLLGYGKVGVAVTAAVGVASYFCVKKVECLRVMSYRALERIAEIPARDWAMISIAGTAGLLAAGPGGFIAASTLTAFLTGR